MSGRLLYVLPRSARGRAPALPPAEVAASHCPGDTASMRARYTCAVPSPLASSPLGCARRAVPAIPCAERQHSSRSRCPSSCSSPRRSSCPPRPARRSTSLPCAPLLGSRLAAAIAQRQTFPGDLAVSAGGAGIDADGGDAAAGAPAAVGLDAVSSVAVQNVSYVVVAGVDHGVVRLGVAQVLPA